MRHRVERYEYEQEYCDDDGCASNLDIELCVVCYWMAFAVQQGRTSVVAVVVGHCDCFAVVSALLCFPAEK